MLYELRIYEVAPGRMADLVARFESMNLRLFARHGIRAVGYWTPADPAGSQFTYMLAWTDADEHAARWGAFISDPELHATIAETDRDGAIVVGHRSQMLHPTAFSPRP